MSEISESYRKVHYDLRPAKQVERLMLLDAFRRLNAGGFHLDRYQYTGMGSIHFYDFSLFHRFAGIEKMLSVEISKKIRKRVMFNRPLRSITVRMDKIGDVLPQLSKRHQHLIWLDYDSAIQRSYLADTAQAATVCSVGSILLVTVDVEPPRGSTATNTLRDHYESEFGELLPINLKPSAFTSRQLPQLNARMLSRAIDLGLRGREGITFMPFFNFTYRDGHRMLTIGGMIVDKDARARVRRTSLPDATYYRSRLDERHCDITVPVLTRKERIHLNSKMPAKPGWKLRDFELSAKELHAYQNIYQFAPNFAELIF